VRITVLDHKSWFKILFSHGKMLKCCFGYNFYQKRQWHTENVEKYTVQPIMFILTAWIS
jgi:hypothetical protein